MSLPPASANRLPSANTLLDAVRQRQAAAATTQLCHWVHRHGLAGLESLRAEVLIPELGPDADLWLQALLELDRPVPPAAPSPAVGHASAAPELGAEQGWQDWEPQPQGSLAPAVRELRERAEAIVDAAFDALEHSFPEAGLPLANPLAAAAPEPASAQLGTLERNLIAEAAADPLPDQASSLEGPDSPETFEELETLEPELASCRSVGLDPAETTESPASPSHGVAFSSLWRRLDRQRVRGLRQWRGVLRDCLEETVSSLRQPDRSVDQDPWESAPSPDSSAEAARSVPESVTSISGGAPQPFRLQDQPAAEDLPAAPPVVFFAAQPSRESAPGAEPLLEAPSLLARLSQARQQRQERRAEAGRSRPAPAPSALSDLRAWLPDAQDLPRAS